MKYFLCVVLFSLMGCVGKVIPNFYEADPIFIEQSDLLKPGVDGVDLGKLKNRIDSVNSIDTRNTLVLDLLTISERVCSRHQASIMANSNTWNVVTGSLTNLFSAVGTVAGGEAAKSGLAAAAAFSGSSRSLVNEEIFQQQLAVTIVRAINIARDKYSSNIENGMLKPLKEYSIKEGLRDIQEYHRRCSFYYGVLEVTKSLDERLMSKSEIDAEMSQLRANISASKGKGIDVSEAEKKLASLMVQRVSAPY